MNALPVADSHDWIATRPGLPGPTDADPVARTTPTQTELAPEERLSHAQRGFLELRLEAALGRLAALETLLEAERLHVRQAQAALGVAERALERHRETILLSDGQRQASAQEVGRLKQALHEAALEKGRQEHRIVALGAALAEKAAEVERLAATAGSAEAELRAARAHHGGTADAMQRECLRLEELLQGERRDKLLLQRALDLARANRRALQDQLYDRRGAVTMAIQPLATPSALPIRLGAAAAPAAAADEPPSSLTLGEDVPPPSHPALTEHVHAACR
ncbi:MAG: hypothetical protein Q8S58_16015 [Bosea sp. (in: a-proteobacteria)]|uniref:hypothetical protein n=1 Tax=Bosea sp. (in: a-proteobacteria) TaxID=1871050 RepID=UPI00273551B0|nr:hypothetical protein [Bosea sp. (in: a-proteobacteria)]MDP3254489.1 hypothetical protein [Bosea sp. (in: a-proteobacteria)]MDP3320630.1 hypothetical protein [Bosea sp. (in: a-proteobacteria)]